MNKMGMLGKVFILAIGVIAGSMCYQSNVFAQNANKNIISAETNEETTETEESRHYIGESDKLESVGSKLPPDSVDHRTYIDPAGKAETQEDLKSLNIGNNLTISYDNGDGKGELNGSLRILILLTLIGIAPSLLIMMTAFTRIIIVLHFTRAALNTQTAPPNQVLVGIALFLTLFIMQPTFQKVYEDAIVPFDQGEITQSEFVENALDPLREFMYTQTQIKDARMFMEIGGYEWTGELSDIPTQVLVPSFIISELRTAFIIGFYIYIPFIVIDMVVASVLMSMGMMMLPPTTISMPFKILLFVMADGWSLIIVNLVKTFYR